MIEALIAIIIADRPTKLLIQHRFHLFRVPTFQCATQLFHTVLLCDNFLREPLLDLLDKDFPHFAVGDDEAGVVILILGRVLVHRQVSRQEQHTP